MNTDKGRLRSGSRPKLACTRRSLIAGLKLLSTKGLLGSKHIVALLRSWVKVTFGTCTPVTRRLPHFVGSATRRDCKPMARSEVIEPTKCSRLACAGFTWRRAVHAQAGSYTA